MRKLESHDWWPELVAEKDNLSLRELAERFGATPGAISAALKRQGISREPAPPGPRRARKRSARPAAPPVPRKAPKKSASNPLDAFRDVLGTVPDDVVADRAGVSRRTVANYRARLGIAGYAGKRRRIHRTSSIDPYVAELGTVPDHVIAAKAGVSTNAVRAYRVRREIPSWRASKREGTEVEPAPVAAAAPVATATTRASSKAKAAPRAKASPKAVPATSSPPVAGVAWRVRFSDGQVAVVIGTTLADAAACAERAGAVEAIERLGDLLA